MAGLLKIIIVCFGMLYAASQAMRLNAYWPIAVVGIVLFGFLFSEMYILRPPQKEG